MCRGPQIIDFALVFICFLQATHGQQSIVFSVKDYKTNEISSFWLSRMIEKIEKTLPQTRPDEPRLAHTHPDEPRLAQTSPD